MAVGERYRNAENGVPPKLRDPRLERRGLRTRTCRACIVSKSSSRLASLGMSFARRDVPSSTESAMSRAARPELVAFISWKLVPGGKLEFSERDALRAVHATPDTVAPAMALLCDRCLLRKRLSAPSNGGRPQARSST